MKALTRSQRELARVLCAEPGRQLAGLFVGRYYVVEGDTREQVTRNPVGWSAVSALMRHRLITFVGAGTWQPSRDALAAFAPESSRA